MPQVVVEVKVTPATTAEDVEATLLSHVTQIAHDTLSPPSPTIFCFDDVGGLGVAGQGTSTAANFIQTLAHHKGIFLTSQKARWMSLAHICELLEHICILHLHCHMNNIILPAAEVCTYLVY